MPGFSRSQALRVFLRTVCAVSASAALSCGQAGQDPNVSYGSAQPVGRWAPEAEPALPAASAQASPTQPAAPPQSLEDPLISPSVPAAGSGSVVAIVGPAGGSIAPPSNPAGRAAAGAAPPPPAAGSGAAPSAAISSVSFDVTTAPVGYRYQPRNIGAIWVQDAGGKFVKSLEVWAGIRARYLTKFSGARAGQPVDVTASATLSSHKAHHASWAMKDRSGAAAAPGKYSLIIELTDGDMTGKFLSVDFDTSLGAQTITPMDTANFKTMKLELK